MKKLCPLCDFPQDDNISELISKSVIQTSICVLRDQNTFLQEVSDFLDIMEELPKIEKDDKLKDISRKIKQTINKNKSTINGVDTNPIDFLTPMKKIMKKTYSDLIDEKAKEITNG